MATFAAAAGGGARAPDEVLDDQTLRLFRCAVGQGEAGFEQFADVGHRARGHARQNLFQIFAGAWVADYPDPQDWLSLQFSTSQIAPGNNVTHFSNPALDRLMAQADINTNQTVRMQQYNTIEQQLVNACPWIPYDQAKDYWLQRSWVQGFGLNALQLMPDINWPGVSILDHSAS